MSLKNNARKSDNPVRTVTCAPTRWPAHSLRLRLMLWYGGLMVLGLSGFGLLVLILASGAINENIQNAVRGETNLVTHGLQRVLSAQPPYWPPILELDARETYAMPGVTIEIFDMHGVSLYASDVNRSLGLDGSVTSRLEQNSVPVWYNARVDGDLALIEASAVYPPQAGASGSAATAQKVESAPMIGVLLVAKSLHDANTTLMLLQGLLLLTGLIVLVIFLACGWAVVGYTLRPLSDLVKTAGSIAATLSHGKRVGSFSQRVRRPGGNDEMSQVVDAFNEMLASIEGSTTMQRRFIADASHELRAPLTTIQGNLAFLIRYIDDIPPAERRTMLADAHGETLRLANLVDELLLLARADTSMGQAVLAIPPAPIVELDRTLLKLVRQVRRRLEIEETAPSIEIGGIDPVRVRGDEENMRRIMVILLDNAVKYTRTEKGDGTITVALQRREPNAVLCISDTGIGIDAKDLPHIFERFYRADLARSREGTGLGLAIAQMLVEQLDGSITAESSPGKGSTFRVTLPLA